MWGQLADTMCVADQHWVDLQPSVHTLSCGELATPQGDCGPSHCREAGNTNPALLLLPHPSSLTPALHMCLHPQIQVLAASPSVKELDITGGAPEMHDQFRFIVKEARALGISVIDRCNLTVLYEPGQEDLPDFLADNGVRIAASLPCYSQENVNKQVEYPDTQSRLFSHPPT